MSAGMEGGDDNAASPCKVVATAGPNRSLGYGTCGKTTGRTASVV
jgi:hypothetical protein